MMQENILSQKKQNKTKSIIKQEVTRESKSG